MNRQLIFLIGIALIVLPWPQFALPYVVKFVLIVLCGLTLIFQSMKRSARVGGVERGESLVLKNIDIV